MNLQVNTWWARHCRGLCAHCGEDKRSCRYVCQICFDNLACSPAGSAIFNEIAREIDACLAAAPTPAPAPAARAAPPCACPIKDLTSTGHLAACGWSRGGKS